MRIHPTRTPLLLFRQILAVASVIAVATGTAQGQREDAAQADGNYAVSFSQVSNNCADVAQLGKSIVRLSQNKNAIEVKIPGIPTLTGTVNPRGKFKAAAKTGESKRFSVSGTAADGTIRLLVIAETYTGGKPVCTQSWNGLGSRKN